MQRITLRSSADQRFLARIVERDGFTFVLDYGEAEAIADATDRIQRGFSVTRDGRTHHVPPASRDLLIELAEFYRLAGLLVELESPFTQLAQPVSLSTLLDRDTPPASADDDEQTELVPAEMRLRALSADDDTERYVPNEAFEDEG